MRPILAIAFAALNSLSLLAIPQASLAQASDCKLVRVAEWPIRLDRGRPIIDGAINGQKANVLLHTAAYVTFVTKETARRLGLSVSDGADFMGDGSTIGTAKLDELRIGSTTARDITVRVAYDDPTPGVDIILGADFMRRYDVELDYAGRSIRIFQPQRCVGGNLAYWDPKAHRVGLERGSSSMRGGDIVVPVVVNGKSAEARIDSSSQSSTLSTAFARRLGIEPPRGVLPAGCGARGQTYWMTRLASFEIGNQVSRDPGMYISPERRLQPSDEADVTLGHDFLRRHRVFVARSQATLYFSHIGGRIFDAVPALPCDERVFGKSAAETREVLGEILARNPRDARALVQRAAMRGMEEAAEAVADLDVVLAVDPRNPMAHSLRADARARLQDYAGALADVEAALQNGMVTAEALAARGSYRRRAQGDLAVALQDYDQAVELDPGNATALRGRGRHLYYMGRLEQAEKDFAAALAIRPSAYDSMWLSDVRERRGQEGRPALEEARARLKEGAWPAPLLDHLLGRIDRPALLAATANADPKMRGQHECEASYYAASRLAATGKADEARPLFQKAVDDCPRNYIEHEAARVALGRPRS